jgi:hypothetical protein
VVEEWASDFLSDSLRSESGRRMLQLAINKVDSLDSGHQLESVENAAWIPDDRVDYDLSTDTMVIIESNNTMLKQRL